EDRRAEPRPPRHRGAHLQRHGHRRTAVVLARSTDELTVKGLPSLPDGHDSVQGRLHPPASEGSEMNAHPTRLGLAVAATLVATSVTVAPAASSASGPDPRESSRTTAHGDQPAPVIGTSSNDRYIVVLDKESSRSSGA